MTSIPHRDTNADHHIGKAAQQTEKVSERSSSMGSGKTKGIHSVGSHKKKGAYK